MRIAVSAESKNGLLSPVSGHFGGSPCFVLADVEQGKVGAVQSVDNPFYPHHEPGQVPGFVASQGANVLLTGGMGARAFQFFQQAGVQAFTGASGTVAEAIQLYLSGQLQSSAACQGNHEHGHGCH